jgi:hypothetical protein
MILNDFSPNTTLPSPWKTFLKGTGSLEFANDTLRLVTTDTLATQYTDAQIDDYQGLARRDFLWRPPLQMMVRARFSHPAGVLKGTAGFGFWNDPFMMTGWRWPALPRVIWFYGSPLQYERFAHAWLRLESGHAGCHPLAFFALLPTALLAVPLMNIGPLYRTLWPIGRRPINVSEAIVPVR